MTAAHAFIARDERARLCAEAARHEDQAARLMGELTGPVGCPRGRWRAGLDKRARRHPKAQVALRRADALRWKLALDLEGLVRREAQDGRYQALEEEDRIQIGLLAAYRAVLRWDPTIAGLPTYALGWITADLLRAANHAQPVDAGQNFYTDRARIHKLRGRHPEWDDTRIGAEAGLSPRRVTALRQLTVHGHDETIGDSTQTWGETLAAEAEDPGRQIDRQRLMVALDGLVDRERELVLAWAESGLSSNSLAKTSRAFGISRERGSQLARRGVERLQIALRAGQ